MSNDDVGLVKAADAMSREMMEAFQARIKESGRIAFRGGVPRKACPAAKGSAARKFWLAGYDSENRIYINNCRNKENR